MSSVTPIEQSARASSTIQSHLSGHGIRVREDPEHHVRDVDGQSKARSLAGRLGAILPVGAFGRCEPRNREGITSRIPRWLKRVTGVLRRRSKANGGRRHQGTPPGKPRLDVRV